MAFNEDLIASIVEQVLKEIQSDDHSITSAQQSAVKANDDWGVYTDVDEAMEVVNKAQKEFAAMPISKRDEIISAIRAAGVENAEYLAGIAHEVTGYGRVEDKTVKNRNAAMLTPGIEDIQKEFLSGDGGSVIIEYGHMGVIASLMPSTHPTAFVINHAIAMLAAGNAIFICPHPKAQAATLEAMKLLNKAIAKAGGPKYLMVAVDKADMETSNKVYAHPYVKMVAAAGGEGVIRAALKSGKKAITGGPGNPPVVVDETADIAKAAKDIIDGESYDNNVLCIAEKEVFVVESVADRLMAEMQKNHAYLIKGQEVAALTNVTIKDGKPNGQLIGKNPSVILREIGIEVGDDVRTVIFEAPPEHPLVMIEQLMPVLPIVRVKDFEEAVKWAVKAEHGDGHTAILHSNDINRITEYARAMQVTALVVNAPSYSCMDPQSKTLVYAHTLTGPTGEGFCTPRHFTRQERIVLGSAFHFV